MTLRIRHLAHVNPSTPAFDALPQTLELTFMPLETVWADQRLDMSRVAAKADVSSGYVRFQDGDVLVPKTAPTFQHARATPVTDLTNGLGAGSSELHILRPRPNSDARFLAYVMRSSTFVTYGVAAYQGVAGLQRVPADVVADWPVAPFDYEEQRRIAHFLDDQVGRIDRAIELRGQERQLIREQRDALIKSIVSGESYGHRLPADLPWLDEVPPHWTTPKITYVSRLGSGHTPSRSRPEWWVDLDVPWITTGEVAVLREDNVEEITETREQLSRLGIENSSAEIHPAGTVVLSRTASAGYSGVMATDMCTSQDFVTWTCTPRLDPYWLLWCLRAMRSDLLGRLAMGSTFKTIYVPDIQTLRIPLPPLGEQLEGVAEIRRIVQAAKRRTELIDRGIGLLEERKQALITAAVTGQFRVTTAGAVA